MADNPEGSLTVVHLNVCPECGTVNSGHLLDPPPHCPHEYERFEPEQFVSLSAVQERERELVGRIEKAHAELIKPYSPLSVIVAQGHLEEALAYRRRESE